MKNKDHTKQSYLIPGNQFRAKVLMTKTEF